MNKVSILNIKYIFLTCILFLVLGCSNDKEDVQGINQIITSNEIKTIFEVDELSSAADAVLTKVYQDNLIGKRSLNSNECYGVNYLNKGYVVTFTNCVLEGIEKVVNGNLTISYTIGEKVSTFTVGYTNFMIGDVLISGTRTFTVTNTTNSLNFTVISDLSIKFNDDFLVEETGSKTLSTILDPENLTNGGLTIEGNWTVKVNEDTYIIAVTSSLQTNLSCPYILQGVIDLNKNGLQLTIDFGDGTCDDIAELTYPDTTKEEISLKE